MPVVLKLLPLQGDRLIRNNPGRCPGLRASAPSGRVGQNLRNFGGAKLRIIETSVKSPLEKVENRIFLSLQLDNQEYVFVKLTFSSGLKTGIEDTSFLVF